MNWGQLKALFVTYLHRADVAGYLPALLPIAEQRVYFGELNSDAVRVQAMLKVFSMPNSALPDDYLQAKRVSTIIGNTDMPLTLRPLDKLPQEIQAYAWQGPTLALSPDVTFPCTLLYYARFAALDTSNDDSTNWLLTNAPALYLNALGVEVGKVLRDDALAARYAGDYASSLDALLTADKRAQISGSLLTQQVRR